MLTDDHIAELIGVGAPEAALADLFDAPNDAGGIGNITVIMVAVSEV